MKKSKDVKFIIYQALYIFVICVIAIKGADLNLDAVELKRMIEPGYVYIDTSGKVLVDREQAKDMIKFDSTKFMIVSKDEFNKNPEKFTGLIITNPIGGIQAINENTTDNSEPIKQIEPGSENTTYTFPSNFVQYRQNSVNNPNNVDMIVNSSAGSVTIPSKSTKSFTLMGDNTVTLTVGNVKKSFPVKPNQKPQVSIQRVTIMNDETKVTTLQKTTCFRVTITDDFKDQLEVKINGPVTFKQTAESVFDITMNAFGSKEAFENYIEGKPDPYSVGFTVSVTDKIAGHKITGQNSFIFGDW